MIHVREAVDTDVEQIRDIFYATYGEHYAYPQYYDLQVLKKLVFGDDTLLLVAEDEESSDLLGTASVLLHVGAYADLVGEFGRLAVRPESRGHHVGQHLMEERLRRVQDQLHVGIVDNRAAHPFSQRISAANGFVPVGFVPQKLMLQRRESIAIFIRHFGDALQLRRNHPRLIPEAHRLATQALQNCGLCADVIVDEESAAYPQCDRFDLEEFRTEGYSTLLRIERGRIRHREIVGPLRLHYGLFQLRARHSTYLVARERGEIVGAVGFAVDDVEKTVRIFELISLNEEPIRCLLNQLVSLCAEKWATEQLEVDVNAHAPRMQRTLLELGFLPVAYLPAFVFHDVERLDVLKMAHLAVPFDLGEIHLHDAVRPIAENVIASFSSREVQPEIAAAIADARLFQGLNDEQAQRLAVAGATRSFQPGEQVTVQDQPGCELFLVLNGEVNVTVDGKAVGGLGPGDCVGELALLDQQLHSATTTAQTPVTTAVLPHTEIHRLARSRPDIGLVMYRNLAGGLGEKLRRADEQIGE